MNPKNVSQYFDLMFIIFDIICVSKIIVIPCNFKNTLIKSFISLHTKFYNQFCSWRLNTCEFLISLQNVSQTCIHEFFAPR